MRFNHLYDDRTGPEKNTRTFSFQTTFWLEKTYDATDAQAAREVFDEDVWEIQRAFPELVRQ